MKTAIWTLTLAFIFLVSFSRLYVGVHSIDQVIASWCIGLSIYILSYHTFIDRHLTNITQGINKGLISTLVHEWFMHLVVFFMFLQIILNIYGHVEPLDWQQTIEKSCKRERKQFDGINFEHLKYGMYSLTHLVGTLGYFVGKHFL